MKNKLLILALTLLASGAQAADEQVTYEFSNAASAFPVSSVTSTMGTMSTLIRNEDKTSGKCLFNQTFSNTYVKNTVELGSGNSLGLMIMPISGDDQGVKTLIVIKKEKVISSEWVDISEDCRLPLGKSTGSSHSEVKVLKWNNTYDIELPDASVLTIKPKKG